MAIEYLNQLPASTAVKRELANLGAGTPAALLGMLHAIRPQFVLRYSEPVVSAIESKLNSMVDSEELESPDVDVSRSYGLGALISKPGTPVVDATDYEERDRLFNEWQQLEQVKNPSPTEIHRMQELEDRIREMTGV